MNKDLLNKCGLLDWHKALFTGEGIRVAVFDDRPYLTDDMLCFAQTPFPADNANEVTHNTKVAKCLHEAAPNAQIFCLAANFGDIERNAKWITENNIDIISTSYSPFVVDDEKGVYKILKDSRIPVFASAGNDGKAELDPVAALSWTVAVGAAADYSNSGESLDCFSYIPAIEVEGRTFTPTGTSFAQPFAAGMLACYMQYANNNNLVVDRQEIKAFIAENINLENILIMPKIHQEVEALKYQYPFKSKFVFGTPYGKKGSLWACGWHSGLDLKSTNYGGDGKVYPIAEGFVSLISRTGGYGNHVYVMHPDGYLSLYAHLKEIFVKTNEKVSLDTVIGQEGTTGNSTGIHLHIEIHKEYYNYPAKIDPQKFLDEKIKESEENDMTYDDFKNFMQQYESEKAAEAVSDWAKPSWEKAVAAGVTDGSAPKNNCTREQMITILDRLKMIGGK